MEGLVRILLAYGAFQWILLGAADFVGAAACAGCHQEQYRKQSGSRHARALRPINETTIPQFLMDRPVREPSGVSFEYEVHDTGFAVTARKGGEQVRAVLEWAFGTGAQGVTPVGRLDGRYFEHRVSYYTEPQRPALTLGHPAGPSPDAKTALGLVQKPETIYRCFNCHATGVKQGATEPDLTVMRPGVECERCHGPGRAHVAAARAGRPKAEFDKTILNAGRFPAKAVVEICGECHRTPPPGRPSRTPELDDPISVRFQPVGFMVSKCFVASKNFSCLTCHDPHEDARHREDAFYAAKCLQCHTAVTRVKKDCQRAAKQNCLPCHMRRAEPVPFLRFTDHRIRVY